MIGAASGAHVTPQFLHYLTGHPEEEIELVQRTNYGNVVLISIEEWEAYRT